ncbi:ATP-binding protein [Pseudooceanicola sp. 502str34]
MGITKDDEAGAQSPNRTASTKPTKSFFIKMLTRDIALDDAVLDLLDNCLDGAARVLRARGSKPDELLPYKGFRAEIHFSKDCFKISDNCGGIPIKLAAERAFRMGRPDVAQSEGDRGTVGVYGIGMKRALFKFGSSIKVTSAGDDPFTVDIGQEWLESEEWDDFDLKPYYEGEVKGGTQISVESLLDSVSDAFSDPDWVKSFSSYVGEHYSILLSKGFEVKIGFAGGTPEAVQPIRMTTYLSDTALEDGTRIAPAIYRGLVSGVQIEIIAGLIAPPKSMEEADHDSENTASDVKAGWTVVCNDRVVVSHDRTHLTGWGRSPIPSYHGQYSVIAGYAFMRSDDVSSLPLTTTKRGIDLNSSVYAEVMTLMQDAIQPFIKFTNDWKTAEQRSVPMKGAAPATLSSIRSEYISSLSFNPVRKVTGVERSVPKLPTTKVKRAKRTCLLLDDDEGLAVSKYYGIDEEAPWTATLGKAWNEAVIRAKKASGK